MAVNSALLAGLTGGLGGLGGQQYNTDPSERNEFGNFLFGKPSGFRQTPRVTPNQGSGIEQLLQRALQYTNPEALKNQARTNFNQQTIPSIAERFSSLGQARPTSGALQSFLGQQGAGLETQLAALEAQLGQSLLPYGLTQQFETAYEQRQPSIIETLLAALAGGAGKAGAAYLGGGF